MSDTGASDTEGFSDVDGPRKARSGLGSRRVPILKPEARLLGRRAKTDPRKFVGWSGRSDTETDTESRTTFPPRSSRSRENLTQRSKTFSTPNARSSRSAAPAVVSTRRTAPTSTWAERQPHPLRRTRVSDVDSDAESFARRQQRRRSNNRPVTTSNAKAKLFNSLPSSPDKPRPKTTPAKDPALKSNAPKYYNTTFEAPKTPTTAPSRQSRLGLTPKDKVLIAQK